ncbi:actin-histidine N-methyltransferase-like isoform X2 [Stegodyphus dumicola]|nr:actin-histidine N-methyltransferase-like isoform X2 [Stegodyphus dumicola]
MKANCALLQTIQELEKKYHFPATDRSQHWEKFYEWCSEHGAKFSCVKVKEISDGNFGVVAEEDIKEHEPFLTIPRKMMMSEISAKNSKLGPLISKDPILQHMPNIQLAMHLLMEYLNPDSFWKPYISILPSTFDTVLYFTLEELQELQGSPVLDEVFKLLRSVARQYCYFFQLFQNDSYAKSLNIGQYFTYDLYRWAVSAVMTRQNVIPSADGSQQVTSLVPFFDMCNHINGKLSTDFNLEQDSLISYACQQFLKGEEVCMFYGPRTNAEFFAHNGFVYLDNENDAVEIKLGISKSDPLSVPKTELCEIMNINLSDHFYIHKGNIISEKLLTFLKINVMKEEEQEIVLRNKQDCSSSMFEKFPDLNRRALLYLKDRLFLLLKCYRTTLQEDEDLLRSSVPESNRLHLALQLRLSEKRILSDAYKYCEENTL